MGNLIRNTYSSSNEEKFQMFTHCQPFSTHYVHWKRFHFDYLKVSVNSCLHKLSKFKTKIVNLGLHNVYFTNIVKNIAEEFIQVFICLIYLNKSQDTFFRYIM